MPDFSGVFMRLLRIALFSALVMAFGAKLVADIPFLWLDTPKGRDNKADPKSPLFVPTNTPFATMATTPVVNTSTQTSTPMGGTNTYTSTITPSPTYTMTITPVGGHGSLLANGENGLTSEWTTFNTDIYDSEDGVTTHFPSPFVVTAGGSSVSGGTPANAFCLNGTLGNTTIGPYPYAVIVMNLVNGWSHGLAGTDVTAYAPSNSLSFSFKGNEAGATYRVDLATGGVTGANYNYFAYDFIPLDTGWNRYTVYFPDGAGTPKFTQAYAPFIPWAAEKASVGAVRFQAIHTASGPYNYCVDDVTFASPPTPTATPTGTNTATPNATNTPPAGFSGKWYDGETAGSSLGDVTLTSVAGPGDSAGFVEMTNGGASGPNYLRVTGTTLAGSYFFAGQIVRPVQNLSTLPFTTLNFSFRVNGASCPRLAVQLTSTNPLSYSAQSVIVNADKYMVVKGPVATNTWYAVSIPVSVFFGANALGGTFAVGELAAINSVQFRPESRSFNVGAITSATLDVDSVTFAGGTAPAVVGKPVSFSDFESFDGASNWATYWSSWTDQDKPDWTCAATGTATSRLFPACSNCPNGVPVIAVPVAHDGMGSDSACSHGRIAGSKGSTGNPGPPSCGAGNYSNAGMGANFDPTGISVDIPTVLGFNPSAISFRVRNGSTCLASSNQQYVVTLVDDPTATAPGCGGCEWQAYFTPTDSWTTVTINFPATGTTGNTYTWGTWPPAGPPVLAMPPNAPATIQWNVGNSGITKLKQISFAPYKNDLCYDLWVDDIRFIP